MSKRYNWRGLTMETRTGNGRSEEPYVPSAAMARTIARQRAFAAMRSRVGRYALTDAEVSEILAELGEI